MAALGSYKVPKPIESEMKVAKMFYVQQALYGLIGLAIGMGICFLLFRLGAGPVLLAFGFFLCVLFTVIGLLLGIAKVPEHMHMYGPGTRIDTIIVRLWKKNRKKNKNIYTRCGLLEGKKK